MSKEAVSNVSYPVAPGTTVLGVPARLHERGGPSTGPEAEG